jgi:hypothetical protein
MQEEEMKQKVGFNSKECGSRSEVEVKKNPSFENAKVLGKIGIRPAYTFI